MFTSDTIHPVSDFSRKPAKHIVLAIVFETVRGRETAVERTRMYPQCVKKILASTIFSPSESSVNTLNTKVVNDYIPVMAERYAGCRSNPIKLTNLIPSHRKLTQHGIPSLQPLLQ